MIRLRVYLCIMPLVVIGFTGPAGAAMIHVNSVAGLQSAINSAVPGDNIIVENGIYTTSAQITVSRVGTAAAPIMIRAATIGGVEIAGTHGFALNSPAAHVCIQGFKFTHASGRNSVNNGATFCRFTRNIFQCSGSGAYLLVAGYDTEVDRNEFRNKSTLGNMIDVRGSGSQIARRVWIHHNYFHDFTNAGGNGAETIRFGLSGLSMSTGDGLIERNLFVRCRGENELISNKSSGNIYRYNTFLESAGAQLTLRHGNDCLAYGNYFRGTDGLRVYGDRHQIFSNYFEGNTKGIDMGNGDGEVADGSELTCHDRPDDCVVTFNTFINNGVHYQMGGRTGGLGATNITVANNLMQGGGIMASISSTAPYTGTWSGNIGWNTGGSGNMPASGYTTVNPLLAADASGVYHIQAGSPVIGTAVGTYAAVTVDMDGQPRDGNKDKGADEFSAAPVTAHLLAASEVGPLSGIFPIEPGTPTDQELIVGSDMIFEVVPLTGIAILGYQWFEVTQSGDVPIGANSAILTIASARKSDDGRCFYCRVTTDAGTFDSRTAQINSQTPLVAYLSFDDGTAKDTSGKGNHGTLVNGASIVNDAERGGVLNLDGTDDYVNLGNAASLDLSEDGRATIAAWVKPAATKNQNSIITKGEWKDAYSLLIKGDTMPANLLWTGNDTSVFSGAAIPIGVWTHAAVVIDGDLATFYINGQASGVANQNRGGPIDRSSASVCIGREQYSGSLPSGRWFFNGRIDEVRIYPSALCADEIHRIFSGSPTGDIDGDGSVTLADFSYISGQWLSAGIAVPTADIAPLCGDGVVNVDDLAMMVNDYLGW
ncbi:MAG: hypothetical protein LLF76_07335 [Planctomycetaceae bacterium]|nr:hypothetical protein [Planctomycetaceae bacterium]